jgi:hypothetical protein
MTNGGELAWLAQDLLKGSTFDAIKFFNDEYAEIMNRYPGEFVPVANAHALEETCRPIVEEMIRRAPRQLRWRPATATALIASS